MADEFEDLNQGDMIMVKYYNRFMELAQYFWIGIADTLLLISKYVK